MVIKTQQKYKTKINLINSVDPYTKKTHSEGKSHTQTNTQT